MLFSASTGHGHHVPSLPSTAQDQQTGMNAQLLPEVILTRYQWLIFPYLCMVLTTEMLMLTISTRLFINTGQFLRHCSHKFASIFQYRIIITRMVHLLLAFRGWKVTPLVVLQNGHVRIDVMISLLRVGNEAPAVVMMHVDTCCWLNNRFYRVAGRT